MQANGSGARVTERGNIIRLPPQLNAIFPKAVVGMGEELTQVALGDDGDARIRQWTNWSQARHLPAICANFALFQGTLSKIVLPREPKAGKSINHQLCLLALALRSPVEVVPDTTLTQLI